MQIVLRNHAREGRIGKKIGPGEIPAFPAIRILQNKLSHMTLYPIETGNFKLDGGAMFGVVPKSLWSRTNPADANNMIEMAARSLLVEDGGPSLS